jgi:predicted transposase YdaD
MLHEADVSKVERNDLITIFAIYLSLADKDLYLKLIEKRRDIMIDSPFYAMIRSEGLEEGLEKGMEKGLEQGREAGLAEGLRWTLVDNLEAMGGTLAPGLADRINAQTDVATLRTWTRFMRSCQTVAEFEAKLGL